MSFADFKKKLELKRKAQDQVLTPDLEYFTEEAPINEIENFIIEKEDTVEVEEEKIDLTSLSIDNVVPKIYSEKELHRLSKMQLDEYVHDYGITLDRRKSKTNMIKEFLEKVKVKEKEE